jgi:hypothetical protein
MCGGSGPSPAMQPCKPFSFMMTRATIMEELWRHRSRLSSTKKGFARIPRGDAAPTDVAMPSRGHAIPLRWLSHAHRLYSSVARRIEPASGNIAIAAAKRTSRWLCGASYSSAIATGTNISSQFSIESPSRFPCELPGAPGAASIESVAGPIGFRRSSRQLAVGTR